MTRGFYDKAFFWQGVFLSSLARLDSRGGCPYMFLLEPGALRFGLGAEYGLPRRGEWQPRGLKPIPFDALCGAKAPLFHRRLVRCLRWRLSFA